MSHPQRGEQQAAERAAYAAVDDALRSYPLRPVPPGLTTAIMAAVSARGRGAEPWPSFRLSWMDFALSGFAALMLAVSLFVWPWLTPETAARLQVLVAAPLLQTDPTLWGVAAAGLAVTAGLLLLAGLVFRRPAPV